MRILAVDTSQIQASVVLLNRTDSGEVTTLASEVGSTSVAHSEAILSLIHKTLQSAGVDLHQVDAFGAGVGPGSFTGLRIGIATMKSFAQVLQKPVLGFSSLQALALSDSNPNTIAMANAYQGQVFLGWVQGETVVTPAEWCSNYIELIRYSIFCGTGAKTYWPQIQAVLGEHAKLSETLHIQPHGIVNAIQKNFSLEHYAKLQANYMRPSQAEIKLESRVAK